MFRRAAMIVMLALTASVWALSGTAGAQDWATKMFADTSHDFGSVARGAAAEYRFKLTNLYKEDVHINYVSSSCGCTKPTITNPLVKSLQTSDIVARFDTRGFLGDHGATITVDIDKPFPATVLLQVHGYIRKDIVITPGRVDLGAIDAGTAKEATLDVAYAGRSDWKIVDVRSANTNLEVELTPKRRENGRVDYELLVRLKPTAPPGYIHDRLTLVTNDDQNKLIPVAVEGNVISALSVSPASLQMGVVKAGQQVTRQLVVRGKEPFKIVRIECDDTSFKFQVSDEARKLHLIPVTYTAGDKAVKMVDKIHIITDSGVLPVVVAHVEVQAVIEQAAK